MKELWSFEFDLEQLERAHDYVNTHSETNITRIIAVHEIRDSYITLVHCDESTAILLYLL